MTGGVRIGRIAGIGVRVHWSVLIIVALIVWSLTAIRLPEAYPGYPSWAYPAAGVSTAVVFFLGLLAHEVSHALVAQRHGVPVDDITLWMFGGVARLGGEARTPGAELQVAGVGPLVSLLIGAGFGVVAVALAAAGRTGLVFGTVAWLSGINVVLAVFNALPAAPLDGGRLLRAVLWKVHGDRGRATVVAARAGRALGALLIALGLWQFLAGAGLGGLWLALIGWFLLGAAGAEEQQARVAAALGGLRVRDIMSPEPTTAPPHITISEFIHGYLWTSRHSAFPLVEQGRLAGLVTVSRIKQVPREQHPVIRLADVACPPAELTVAAPHEPVTDLLPRLHGCADGRALVMIDEHLVGIVSPSDISRALQRASLRGVP